MKQGFFYKERDLKQEKNTIAFNMPKDVEKDYIKHFKSLKPDLINEKTNKLNNNQILLNLLVDYLNMQCLERGEFNIEILIAIDKNENDNITPLAIRNNKRHEHRNMQEYFTTVKTIPDANTLFSTYLKANYFNRYIDWDWVNYIKKYKNSKFYIIMLNNVLDEFRNGQYHMVYNYKKDENNKLNKCIVISPPHINTHEGLSVLNKEEESFLHYIWDYNPSSEYFDIEFMKINKEELELMINNSSNQKLKNYYKKNYKKIMKKSCNDEVPTDHKAEIKQLREKIRKLKKENEKLKHRR